MSGIEVDGLRELNLAVRRAVDSDLPKRMGLANKAIGELVISKLSPSPDPAAVGIGAGATVRASASKREVLLRVGGAHRAKPPLSVWGKRRSIGFGRSVPKRPFITETARRHEDEIADAYLHAVANALSPAFYDTEP